MNKNKDKAKQAPAQEAETQTAEEINAETTQEEQTEPAASQSEAAEPECCEPTQPAEKNSDEADRLREELNKQKDVLLRTAAEYENYRKRSEREKRAIYADATADAVAAILPIADSLEFAVKAQDGATEEYQKGLELVNKQFQDALTKLGVSAIGEPGDEFDPNLHNAVAHVDDDTVTDNTIVEVFQKGYKLGDKVIRHAMVKVAN